MPVTVHMKLAFQGRSPAIEDATAVPPAPPPAEATDNAGLGLDTVGVPSVVSWQAAAQEHAESDAE